MACAEVGCVVPQRAARPTASPTQPAVAPQVVEAETVAQRGEWADGATSVESRWSSVNVVLEPAGGSLVGGAEYRGRFASGMDSAGSVLKLILAVWFPVAVSLAEVC